MSKANPQLLLSQAFDLHKIGRLADAISLYQQALQITPKHPGALNLMGVALMQIGRLQEAADTIEKAIKVSPDQADSHFNLATVLQGLERYEEAIGHFKKSIALKPNDPQSHNNLGAALNSVGRNEESLPHFERAIALAPDYPDAYYNKANALVALKRYAEAIGYYEKASTQKLNPDIHINLGTALRHLGRIEDALKAYEAAIAMDPSRPEPYMSAGNMLLAKDIHVRAIPYFEKVAALRPEMPEAHFNLATCLHAIGRLDETERAAEKGLALKPDSADAEVALASFLQELNRHAEALPHFEKALSLDSKHVNALLGLSHTLQALQRHEEAVTQLDLALAINPQNDRASWNRGVIRLALGKFDAWKLLQFRFSDEVQFAVRRAHSAPQWDGKKLAGTLAVWGEQGLGDQIMYASIVPNAMDQVDTLILEVEPRLVPLFSRSFPDARVTSLSDDPNSIQPAAHTAMGDLGELFRPDMDSFPRRAFLVADELRTAKLKEKLGASGKKIIGLSWRSVNPKFGIHKTARLRDFEALLRHPESKFVDLQYGQTDAELVEIKEAFGVRIEKVPEIDNTNDIDGLASLIMACDAIVTVSNTTAHIAGALGKPVWILVPHGQGRLWYWFKDRTDSPWYPGARIRRQKNGQSWSDLIASIEPEIAEFLQSANGKS